jgi:ADP-heptose:LPS heptosyltransferase
LKKILIIRFSSIGDIVLTTPVIRCLKQQLKDSEIHFLTKEQFVPIVKANPYIDKIHFIKNDLKQILLQLKSENFDFIVDLHKNFRSVFVKLKLRKTSKTYNKLNIKKWLLVNFKINLLPEIHIVDRYFEAVKILSVKNDGKGLDYFIPENEKVNISELPSTHQNGFIGFAIGGKHNTKMFPVEKIISICKKINMPVVLLGGYEDIKTAEYIKKSVGDKIYNACGKYSINQSASLVRQAEKIITNDTGLMHIAAAFKKQIISIWGNTVPAFGMYPYMPETEKNKSVIVEIKNLRCRPCSKLGYKKCPKGHFDCMQKITEEKIIETQNLSI